MYNVIKKEIFLLSYVPLLLQLPTVRRCRVTFIFFFLFFLFGRSVEKDCEPRQGGIGYHQKDNDDDDKKQTRNEMNSARGTSTSSSNRTINACSIYSSQYHISSRKASCCDGLDDGASPSNN